MRYSTPTKHKYTYEVPVHLHLGGTSTPTRYSTVHLQYEVKIHYQGTAIPLEVQPIYEVHLCAPTRYNHINEVQLELNVYI
jgi:hypothetical protein